MLWGSCEFDGRGICTVASDADGVMVDSEGVCVAIVEPIALLKVEVHRKCAIAACKFDPTWYRGVFATLLIPKIEDVTGGDNRRRGDDCFNHVSAVETRLVVRVAIREGNREEPPLSDSVVGRQGDSFKSNRNLDRRDVADIHKSMEVAGNTNIRTAID